MIIDCIDELNDMEQIRILAKKYESQYGEIPSMKFFLTIAFESYYKHTCSEDTDLQLTKILEECKEVAGYNHFADSEEE